MHTCAYIDLHIHFHTYRDAYLCVPIHTYPYISCRHVHTCEYSTVRYIKFQYLALTLHYIALRTGADAQTRKYLHAYIHTHNHTHTDLQWRSCIPFFALFLSFLFALFGVYAGIIFKLRSLWAVSVWQNLQKHPELADPTIWCWGWWEGAQAPRWQIGDKNLWGS